VTDRYLPDHLVNYVGALFNAAGMPADRAQTVARLLVDADCMGHDTHGLNLAAHYLTQLDGGQMLADGDPDIINDHGACLSWDGNYLSGVWLTHEAIKQAIARARNFGIGSVSIRRSHHIACLATFLTQATDKGMVIMLACSDPAETGVAPYGAVQGCFTPNPIAFGYPTEQDPVLIDISASITTLGMSGRLRNENRKLGGDWLIDAAGNATDDPAVLVADPPGALLPLGGMDAGHKGFGLALMIETLTSGLAGFGRADGPTSQTASVFIQVFDPQAFGGAAAMTRETQHLTQTCRAATTAPDMPPVRLPGQRALQKMRESKSNGVELYAGIMQALSPWAERYQIEVPGCITT